MIGTSVMKELRQNWLIKVFQRTLRLFKGVYPDTGHNPTTPWTKNINWTYIKFRRQAFVQSCSVKRGFLENFAKFTGNIRARVSETLAQVFSRKFCEILKNTLFIDHLQRLDLLLDFDKNHVCVLIKLFIYGKVTREQKWFKIWLSGLTLIRRTIIS